MPPAVTAATVARSDNELPPCARASLAVVSERFEPGPVRLERRRSRSDSDACDFALFTTASATRASASPKGVTAGARGRLCTLARVSSHAMYLSAAGSSRPIVAKSNASPPGGDEFNDGVYEACSSRQNPTIASRAADGHLRTPAISGTKARTTRCTVTGPRGVPALALVSDSRSRTQKQRIAPDPAVVPC